MSLNKLLILVVLSLIYAPYSIATEDCPDRGWICMFRRDGYWPAEEIHAKLSRVYFSKIGKTSGKKPKECRFSLVDYSAKNSDTVIRRSLNVVIIDPDKFPSWNRVIEFTDIFDYPNEKPHIAIHSTQPIAISYNYSSSGSSYGEGHSIVERVSIRESGNVIEAVVYSNSSFSGMSPNEYDFTCTVTQ